MPRLHILSSWVGAAEYDEGDTYSGEQVGRRSQKSVGVTIERDGDQWKGHITPDGRANLAAYSDKPKGRTVKPEQPITHTINSHAAKLDKLDQQEKRLINAFMADEIDAEQYEESYYILCMHREKAYKAYMKSIGKEAEWQRQNAEQLAEYRREEQPPGRQPIEWQSVAHNVANTGKRFYCGMATQNKSSRVRALLSGVFLVYVLWWWRFR